MDIIKTSLGKILNSQDLSFNESANAMNEIMTGQVSDILFSSWLTALRMKGESVNEIAGFASIMRKFAHKINCNDKDAIDVVGTGGDGAHTINISTTSAIVAAGAGVTVAKHGNKAVSSKSGSADVFSALGIKIDITPDEMERCVNEIGLAFLFAPKLHPAMKYAMPVRKELGMRSIFNILGPICNPANVKRGLVGVYDKKLCPIIAQALADLGAEHFLVVHGNDGLDEFSIASATYVCEVRNNEITEYEISPEKFGLKTASLKDIEGGLPEENSQIIKDTLSNKITGAKRDVVLLNSAAAIYVSNKTNSWEEAFTLAEKSIDTGNAIKKLEELIKFTTLS